MNKAELFKRTQALWPKSVDLTQSSSGIIEGVTLAQLLNELYYSIEGTIDENDHWMQIAIWAYYQAIPKKTLDELLIVSPWDVSFEDFDKMMFQNLNGDECWVKERKIWNGITNHKSMGS